MNTYAMPDKKGHFGIYGGRYVPETLMQAAKELEEAYEEAIQDEQFLSKLKYLLTDYVGRETPLYYAENLTKYANGPKIYLKREDLNHTGAHKINNTIGQALLAVRMGKKKIVAETGAGQHGVATATVCALLNLECVIFMGEEDIKRQQLNVFRMELLGAKVESVTSGSRTLKDACNEALRYWVSNVNDTHYILGSVMGPHPFPMMVRDFQSVIGQETKEQYFEREGKLPDALVACIGGGSNSMGMFYPFIKDEDVKLYGVEAAGLGLDTDKHAASLTKGKPGVLHGALMYLLQDEAGQIQEAHSVSAGLDYPGVGPEHSYLKDTGRVNYESITDEEALEGLQLLCQLEGIIPALESSHAVAYALKLAKEMNSDEGIVICLSGRGDKDVQTVKARLGGDKIMNRIEKAFQALKDNNEKAFVPYIMAGDGGLDSLMDKIVFLEKCGATAIEIGIPFSDPVADGPTIQEAGIRALKEGTTLKDVIATLQTLRPIVSIPLIVMTYMNPIYAYGVGTFVDDAKKAGVDGCIIPDLPIEEEDAIEPYLEMSGIELIRLVTLTSPKDRVKEIAGKGKGFLYAVTVTGITGARTDFNSAIGEYLMGIKEVSPIPVLAGFGISTPEHVKQMGQFCDGVVVGSKIVDLFHQGRKEQIEALILASRTVKA